MISFGMFLVWNVVDLFSSKLLFSKQVSQFFELIVNKLEPVSIKKYNFCLVEPTKITAKNSSSSMLW